jgi:hypothetical protein
VGTFGLYLFLPAKAYYFVGLLPVWCWLIARSVTHLTFRWRSLLAVGLIVGAAITAWQGRSTYYQLVQTEAFPLAPKLAAVDRIYELSQDNAFDSYHYVNEIYDYTYQFIYRYNQLRGYLVPREYSYAPGEISYVQNKMPPTKSASEKVFLIVEKPLSPIVFDDWWQRVTADLEVKEEIPINQSLRIFTARRHEYD